MQAGIWAEQALLGAVLTDPGGQQYLLAFADREYFPAVARAGAGGDAASPGQERGSVAHYEFKITLLEE
jgi:hypothetical protein